MKYLRVNDREDFMMGVKQREEPSYYLPSGQIVEYERRRKRLIERQEDTKSQRKFVISARTISHGNIRMVGGVGAKNNEEVSLLQRDKLNVGG